MGFLDSFTDGLQISPSGFSRPAATSKHHHQHHHTKDSSSSRVRKRHRSRSRSSSRSRGLVSSDSRRRRRGGGGAASPASPPGWGGGGRNDDDYYYDRARGALAASGLGGLFGGDSSDTRHHAASSSRGSFFGLGNTSRSSFFNFGNRSSYYKRSPRHGFMARAYRRLKRLLRDLVHYAKRHPWKVFFLVVMPLLTTGVLGSLLARFGLRIPPSLERMLGMASRAASGDSLGLVSDAVRMAGEFGSGSSSSRKTSTLSRGYDGDLQWERRSSYRSGGGGGGDGDWGNTVADLARRFF